MLSSHPAQHINHLALRVGASLESLLSLHFRLLALRVFLCNLLFTRRLPTLLFLQPFIRCSEADRFVFLALLLFAPRPLVQLLIAAPLSLPQLSEPLARDVRAFRPDWSMPVLLQAFASLFEQQLRQAQPPSAVSDLPPLGVGARSLPLSLAGCRRFARVPTRLRLASDLVPRAVLQLREFLFFAAPQKRAVAVLELPALLEPHAL